MIEFILGFLGGFAVGGSLIGWFFWNKKQQIQKELENLRSRIGAGDGR